MSSETSSIAHAPRRRVAIGLRWLRYAASQGPRRIAGLQMPEHAATIGVVAGRDGAADTVRDALARLAWILDERVRVVVPVEPSSALPDWVSSEVTSLPQRIEVGNPRYADVVLLASASGLRWLPRMVRPKVQITDPHWYSRIEVDTYAQLSSVGVSAEEWSDIDRLSQVQFESLLGRYGGSERVAVFGTGPSMTEIDPRSIGAELVIACNSAVSNPEWIERARPGLVVFADPVFHFGPSRYAGTFRRDLIRVAESTDSVFAFPRRFAPLMLRRFPELRGRVVAVDPLRGLPLDSLSVSSLAVPQTANVLTLMMLPFAAALGREIAIAGCDGRRPDEKYFWTHNAEAQYEGSLMMSTFEAHPSFFRDRDYVTYYEAHCAQLESMLTDAETRGLTFASVTPSAIPALQRRSRDLTDDR